MMMAGKGDEIPVSKIPPDGTHPSMTTRWEKRNVAEFVPSWDPELCIQCGNCSFVCPHGVIRARLFDQNKLAQAPTGFKSAPIEAKGFPDTRYTLQVYAEDCTGCRLCYEACPARDKVDGSRRALEMVEREPVVEPNRAHLSFFEKLPVNDRSYVDFSTVRGAQFLEPLFEFPGACAGCGEAAYVKLMTQLFGDRLMVANASGCSSVYGGCHPTTPYAINAEGRGPAWNSSLFEDNAEYGYGMRLAADRHMGLARRILAKVTKEVGEDLAYDLVHEPQRTESDIRRQRARVALLKERLAALDTWESRQLMSVAEHLVRRSVWLVGGDGWAYDIGSAGLDHVLALGPDVNALVLDTEVYSNTGGQASKSTPMGAVAKFANAGKPSGKKDLALQAISYGHVYVARVALGANPQQTLNAFREAEAYPGPSLIIAYSPCIAHGIAMDRGLDQQSLAVHSGYWPLLRYNPEARKSGENPFVLDSTRPRLRFAEYAENELRFRMLRQTNPNEADSLMAHAQEWIDHRWALYEQMALLTNPA